MKIHASFGGNVVVAAMAIASPAATGLAAEAQASFVEPSTPEVRSVRDTGDRAIDRLAYTMVTDIMSAVARDGPVKALDVAHLKGLPTTGGTVAGLPRITAMKLTSLKVRNPANAPDPAEKLALDRVQSDLEAGTPPAVLVQRVDLPGEAHEWRVYKPLAVLKDCVACHGRSESQSAELRAALQQRYPDDQAIGYRAGELRGLFRVTVAEPSPAAPPPQPAPASPAKKKS
jgi:hypothetical protein